MAVDIVGTIILGTLTVMAAITLLHVYERIDKLARKIEEAIKEAINCDTKRAQD